MLVIGLWGQCENIAPIARRKSIRINFRLLPRVNDVALARFDFDADLR